MLNIENYSVAYGQSQIIEQLNMTVAQNQILALLGRNGMGKTTLMKALIGMIPAKSGQVLLDKRVISHQKSYQRVRSGLGFVPQGRMVFSSMTVEDNIKTGLANGKNRTIPEEIYHYFPVLLTMKRRLAGNLSGGQQQQLAIARALASQPKLLLLDEPTEGIQPSIIKEMAHILRKIRDEQGLTILVSEQVLSFALDVADRICIMEKGTIRFNQDRENFSREQIAAYLSV